MNEKIFDGLVDSVIKIASKVQEETGVELLSIATIDEADVVELLVNKLYKGNK